MRLIVVPVAILFFGVCTAQPGGGGITVSGQTSATSCTSSTCHTDGTGNYVSYSLTYSTDTGKFSGSITTNQCPSHAGDYTQNGASVGLNAPTATCITQALPAPAYASPPLAAPLRGRVGLAIHGENIYGPMDAGFTTGMTCDNGVGSCPAGTDVHMCEAALERTCGTGHLKTQFFMSDCGGHASPYHFHCGLYCDFNVSNKASHSSLVGIMLDGRGLYGEWEGGGAAPSDLDACGGHYGPVPSSTLGGVTYAAASNVYHYHTQGTVAPFFVGCYGPVTSLTQAKGLYSSCTTSGTCSSSSTSTCSAGQRYQVCTSVGYADYTLDCPVYRMGSDTFNQVVPTSDCPVCEGNCAVSGATASPSAAAATTPTSTATGTATGTSTRTATQTGTATATGTGSATYTMTLTSTATGSATATATSTFSATSTSTANYDPNATTTATSTGTATGTSTSTGSLTSTATATASATATHTRNADASPSSSPPPSSSASSSTSPSASAPAHVYIGFDLSLRPAAADAAAAILGPQSSGGSNSTCNITGTGSDACGAGPVLRAAMADSIGVPLSDVTITSFTNGLTGVTTMVDANAAANTVVVVGSVHSSRRRRLATTNATIITFRVDVPASNASSITPAFVSGAIASNSSTVTAALAVAATAWGAAVGAPAQPVTVASSPSYVAADGSSLNVNLGSDSSSKLSAGAIVGIVIAIVAVFALLFGAWSQARSHCATKSSVIVASSINPDGKAVVGTTSPITGATTDTVHTAGEVAVAMPSTAGPAAVNPMFKHQH